MDLKIYLLIINLISILIFLLDKYFSKNNLRRISEFNLHFVEILGGVFGIIFMMYLIRHKNRKKSYFIITFLICFIWILFIFKGQNYIFSKFS